LIADDFWKFGIEIQSLLSAHAKRANGRITYLDEKRNGLLLLPSYAGRHLHQPSLWKFVWLRDRFSGAEFTVVPTF
jgi:hypothetical protein